MLYKLNRLKNNLNCKYPKKKNKSIGLGQSQNWFGLCLLVGYTQNYYFENFKNLKLNIVHVYSTAFCPMRLPPTNSFELCISLTLPLSLPLSVLSRELTPNFNLNTDKATWVREQVSRENSNSLFLLRFWPTHDNLCICCLWVIWMSQVEMELIYGQKSLLKSRNTSINYKNRRLKWFTEGDDPRKPLLMSIRKPMGTSISYFNLISTCICCDLRRFLSPFYILIHLSVGRSWNQIKRIGWVWLLPPSGSVGIVRFPSGLI